VADEVAPDLVVGSWTRAYEEDAEGNEVYRRSDYDFPPARRPRPSIDLEPGGVLTVASPGPDDRRRRSTGSWELQGNRLILRSEDAAPTALDVLSVEPDRLVVRPGDLTT
jgi:hypothetical protein